MRRLLAVLLLGLVGCRSSGAVDWDAVGLELELASEDIDDAAELVESPALATDLRNLSGFLAEAAAAVEGAGDSDPLAALRAALTYADGLADRLPEDEADSLRLAVFAARAALRRYEAYAAAEATSAG